MRTARAKFRLGARVTMTRAGHRWICPDKSMPTSGIVAGYSRDKDCVRVMLGGHWAPQTYHKDFWKVTQP